MNLPATIGGGKGVGGQRTARPFSCVALRCVALGIVVVNNDGGRCRRGLTGEAVEPTMKFEFGAGSRTIMPVTCSRHGFGCRAGKNSRACSTPRWDVCLVNPSIIEGGEIRSEPTNNKQMNECAAKGDLTAF
jgi:hypothetical protein